ncbi:MAG: SIS domain-containing protein [Candidatus Gastranaerophilales bacterium]|nr:SIS domain-containing protein [Candidatus Gastranaerophilales bacterium]
MALTSTKNENSYLFKEIMEQGKVFKDLCSKFIDANYNIKEDVFPVKNWNKIVICASGSSKNAGEISKYIIEKLAKVSCAIEYASEYAHKDNVLGKDDLFIAISQSGNTADTFEALKKAKAAGATTFAITNCETSKIHTNADYKVLADAGVENSIAATKSFTAQLLILFVFAMKLAEKTQNADLTEFKKEFVALGDKYDEVFAQREKISAIAQITKEAKSLAVLGRHINSALALEGSLKIKETCYINAMNSPAGEFMHGHFAVLDNTIPVIAMLNKSEDEENYKLALHNLCEIKSKRNVNVILIKNSDDSTSAKEIGTDLTIDVPNVNSIFTPFMNLIVLQLIAFETASILHDNIDSPRDLIKCVAAE